MKAIVCTKIGTPDFLKLEEVPKPIPSDFEVLVKVHAASVNYSTTAYVTGKPSVIRLMGGGLLKPKYRIPGAEVAGKVETVGRNVKQFRPGDEVFGDLSACGRGGFAEYVCAPENAVALKPANLSFEQAAARFYFFDSIFLAMKPEVPIYTRKIPSLPDNWKTAFP